MTDIASVRRELASKWWLFTLDGLILVVMGGLLACTQLVAATAFIEIVGIMLLIGAIIGIFTAAQATSAGSTSATRWMPAIIAAALGIFLLADPTGSIKAIAWVFGLGTLLLGALQLSAGLGLVGHQARGVFIVLGLLALIAGFIMMSNPLLTAWVLSIFFGIQFILTGLFRIGMASKLRRING
ncbi:MAG: DUF308 domain-containing protein [Phycisphaerales bacterium]|nr:DUF308 domain-containing protein [Phycisphaerales bacterium]